MFNHKSKTRECGCFGDDGDVSVSANVDVDSLVQTGVDYGSDKLNAKQIATAVGSGAALGAAIGGMTGPAAPILAPAGAIIGAIGGAIESIGPSVLHALQGQCTITIAGLDTDCSDYPRNVQGCAQWVKDHADIAIGMDPDALASQTKVVIPDFADWVNTLGGDYQNKIRSNPAWPVLQKLPGTRSILLNLQIPAATALAAATPELIGLYKLTFPNSFPALTPDIIAKIAMKVQPLLDAKIQEAGRWIATQPLYPTFDQVHHAFPMLVPEDVNRAMAMTPANGHQVASQLKGLRVYDPKAELAQLQAFTASAKFAPPKTVTHKEKWWQRLLEKIHLRKKPLPTTLKPQVTVPISQVLRSGKFQVAKK